ncbi:MAG: sugar phosphate isomerase/epimerase family protein [Armatimonadota bacterium]|jgi:sugar phosphate isomerase/epimerase
MKVGIGAARFGDMQEAFQMAPEIGFNGLEIPFNSVDDYEAELIFTREGVQQLRGWAEQYAVEMPSCVAGRYNHRGFPDEDPAVRAEAVELMMHLIDRCAEAGIGNILVAFFGSQMLDSEERIERAVEGVRECAQRAESQGVTLALEGTVDVETWLRIIEAIDSDAVGVYYDVGNAARFGLDGPSELRRLDAEGLLAQIHIKDMTLEHRNMPLGEGAVDWSAVSVALREISYDDYLVLETPRSDNPRADYAAWLEFTHALVSEE